MWFGQSRPWWIARSAPMAAARYIVPVKRARSDYPSAPPSRRPLNPGLSCSSAPLGWWTPSSVPAGTCSSVGTPSARWSCACRAAAATGTAPGTGPWARSSASQGPRLCGGRIPTVLRFAGLRPSGRRNWAPALVEEDGRLGNPGRRHLSDWSQLIGKFDRAICALKMKTATCTRQLSPKQPRPGVRENRGGPRVRRSSSRAWWRRSPCCACARLTLR